MLLKLWSRLLYCNRGCVKLFMGRVITDPEASPKNPPHLSSVSAAVYTVQWPVKTPVWKALLHLKYMGNTLDDHTSFFWMHPKFWRLYPDISTNFIGKLCFLVTSWIETAVYGTFINVMGTGWPTFTLFHHFGFPRLDLFWANLSFLDRNIFFFTSFTPSNILTMSNGSSVNDLFA